MTPRKEQAALAFETWMHKHGITYASQEELYSARKQFMDAYVSGWNECRATVLQMTAWARP